jgi:hypothetical protein
MDDEFAGRLKVFLTEGNVKVVAVEDMEGEQGRSAILGPATEAALRQSGTRTVGVDALLLSAEMRKIQELSLSLRAQHANLFQAVRAAFQRLADLSPSSLLADFVRTFLRHRKPSGQFDANATGKALLDLAGRTHTVLPTDVTRALEGLARQSLFDEKRYATEMEELVRRAKANWERLLSPKEKEATRVVIERLKPFYLTGETERYYISYDANERRTTELEERLKATHFDSESATLMLIGDRLPDLIDVARVMGVDIEAYPNICRLSEKACLMRPLIGEGYAQRTLAAIERAWAMLENAAATSDNERTLLAGLPGVSVLERLAFLEVQPAEYNDISDLGDGVLTNTVAALAALGVAVDPSVVRSATKYDSLRVTFERFYDLARRRARQMASLTVELARKHGNRGVLICLGFHVPTIKATWVAERVTYEIILP